MEYEGTMGDGRCGGYCIRFSETVKISPANMPPFIRPEKLHGTPRRMFPHHAPSSWYEKVNTGLVLSSVGHGNSPLWQSPSLFLCVIGVCVLISLFILIQSAENNYRHARPLSVPHHPRTMPLILITELLTSTRYSWERLHAFPLLL